MPKKNSTLPEANIVNFQIQHFRKEHHAEFKQWSHNNKLGADSMKSLLVILIKNRDAIEKTLTGKK